MGAVMPAMGCHAAAGDACSGSRNLSHHGCVDRRGGVCGTALLHVLARYTTLSHLTLVERYGHLAQVNSRASSNSQTIHCGDIETNYTLEKALKVKRIAGMIGRYASQLPRPSGNAVCSTPRKWCWP